jgi:hypothetical protein
MPLRNKTAEATIDRIRVEIDHPYEIFSVELKIDGVIATKFFRDSKDMEMYLQGARMTIALMDGHLEVSPIPPLPTKITASAPRVPQDEQP